MTAHGTIPIITASGLSKTFPAGRRWTGGSTAPVKAVDAVSFTIGRGQTVGLVGESGSGKTTVGRALLRLVELDAGQVLFTPPESPPVDITTLSQRELRPFRRRLQIIFQDPYQSLNPARPVWEIVGEGLFIHEHSPRRTIRDRSAAILKRVGLANDVIDRPAGSFSGGQRQRIAIARALILEPDFVVCDEITSALDTQTQAAILELLKEMRERFHLSLLFISHDLHTVASVSDQILVMRQGRIVEDGTPDQIFDHPGTDYTRELVAAIPVPDPRRRTLR